MIGVGDFKSNKQMEKNVLTALRSGRVSYGPMCKELEQRWADIHQCGYGIATNSGTDALRIALHAAKIANGWKDGAKIVVPSVTFVATINIVYQVGLRPVVVDVEKETANMDPLRLEMAIKGHGDIVGAIPVHLFGNMAKMDKIDAICTANNVEIIEDACEAAFSFNDDMRAAGTYGSGCFSFYAAHHIVGGVGGIITTNNEHRAELMRSLVNHGRDSSYISMDDRDPSNIPLRFKFNHMGYSSRIMELQAAMILPQLDGWCDQVSRRREIAMAYRATGVRTINAGRMASWMMFPIFAEDKFRVMLEFEKRGIETRETLPLTNQPCYANEPEFDGYWPHAEYINERGFYIPCHHYLTDKEVAHIVKAIEELVP